MPLKKQSRRGCASASRVSARLLLSFLAVSAPAASLQASRGQAPQIALPAPVPGINIPQINSRSHDFTLRHIFHHGTHQDPKLHKRLDVNEQASWIDAENQLQQASSYPHLHAKSRSESIQRLSDRRIESIEFHLSTARDSGHAASLDASAWTIDDVSSPNVTDKDTIVSLARMAGNAYVPIVGEGEWADVNNGFNYSQSFGWEGDGLRGHIFADESNSTIVIGLKGTSMAVFDGAETTTNDKENDNLFFSCCCGQGGQYFWRQVCDCQTDTYTCNTTCIVKALRGENRYYRAAINLYTNVTQIYPDSQVWLTGHSLGGSVSSLLGMTFGLPVVTFEAPGDALPAQRLGLPSPPEYDATHPQTRRFTGAYHFGNTADPIFMGTCNSASALCTYGGYALESQCHTGLQCVYDTVGDKGWRVGIGNHKVQNVINNVIIAYDDLPECKPDTECVDCYNWKYFESNGSDTTTTTTSSTSSTTSTTRTSTCETPGWWGCRDETTTTTSDDTTTTSTSTTTTSTCETPGWFGCNDPTTTTTSTTTSSSSSSSSSAAKATPAPSITTTTSPPPTAPVSTSATRPAATSSCETPGWFWCKDKKTASSPAPSTSTSTPAPKAGSTSHAEKT